MGTRAKVALGVAAALTALLVINALLVDGETGAAGVDEPSSCGLHKDPEKHTIHCVRRHGARPEAATQLPRDVSTFALLGFAALLPASSAARNPVPAIS